MGDRSRARRRTAPDLLAFGIVAVLLVVALFSAIGALNRDVYGAAGFVRQYLDALARHDATGAMSLDGVLPEKAAGAAGGLPSTLLRSSVLGSLTDVTLTNDTTTTGGVHAVTYRFVLDGKPAAMTFKVQREGDYLGVFNRWRFSVSPLAVLRVTVLHDPEFSVNGLTLDARAHAAETVPQFTHTASYLAFAPTAYSFSHLSPLLVAPPTKVQVTKPGVTEVSIDVEPNKTFIEQVQTELDKFLDDCAKQHVLKPTNCPFGIDIDDRVIGTPDWSIATYPKVILAAGDTSFDMPDADGLARIVVKVQSLFDGEISTRDENVSFAVGLSVVINPDGSLRIQLH